MRPFLLLAVAALLLITSTAHAESKKMKEARKALDEGRLEDVEELCREITEDDRDWRDSRCVLGEALLRERRFAEAEACFRPFVESSRRDVVARLGLGRALAGQRDVPGAEELFKEVLDIDRKNVEALRELGRLLSPIGRGGEARTHLEKAWRLDSKSIDTARLLIEVHVVGYKDYSSGRKVAEAITKAHRKSAVGWHLLADVRLAEGKSEEAIEALRRGAKADPKDAEAHGRLADLLLEHADENPREKRREEALEHYDVYLELGGEDPDRILRADSLRPEEE